MTSVDTAELQAVEAAIARHGHEPGPLIVVLHAVQDALGYIPEHSVRRIAEALNLSRAEVHGVVTFYHYFRTHKPGVRTVQICRAEACQSVQGEALAEQVLAHFGVEWGGTTPDGRITVEATYCLGLCASGPSAMLDGEPMARLTAASIGEIAREVGR